MSERPDTVHGRLMEAIHLTGYTFERAIAELKWLLQEDRWRQVGNGFDDPHEFVATLRLDTLKHSIEQRKEIAGLLAGIGASHRATARVLGVSHTTVQNDLGNKLPPTPSQASQTCEGKTVGGKELPPPAISLGGSEAAKLIEKERARKERADGRIERVRADEERTMRLVPALGKYRTIVLDPAWDYEWLSLAGRAKPGYAMQSHEELLALKVRELWADEKNGCHLYLWVTNNFIGRGCQLMAHWGFQHRTMITWVKEGAFGLGSYFRNSTEHVLFGTLGETTTRHNAASIPTHFDAPRGEHSEKPERFYEIVRAASYPPYGEGNQRQARPDFADLYRLEEAA